MQITISTQHKRQIVDVTSQVYEAIESQGIKRGILILSVLHTTAALTTADLDPGTDQDILDGLEAMIPQLHFRHPHDPLHARDHILASVIGPSLALTIEGGHILLGSWQRVVLVELDGPRERNLALMIQPLA